MPGLPAPGGDGACHLRLLRRGAARRGGRGSGEERRCGCDGHAARGGAPGVAFRPRHGLRLRDRGRGSRRPRHLPLRSGAATEARGPAALADRRGGGGAGNGQHPPGARPPRGGGARAGSAYAAAPGPWRRAAGGRAAPQARGRSSRAAGRGPDAAGAGSHFAGVPAVGPDPTLSNRLPRGRLPHPPASARGPAAGGAGPSKLRGRLHGHRLVAPGAARLAREGGSPGTGGRFVPADHSGVGPGRAADVGSHGGHSRTSSAPKVEPPAVLDNVAQFRFYSGWRAAVERRR